jgi:hypothetical protein
MTREVVGAWRVPNRSERKAAVWGPTRDIAMKVEALANCPTHCAIVSEGTDVLHADDD